MVYVFCIMWVQVTFPASSVGPTPSHPTQAHSALMTLLLSQLLPDIKLFFHLQALAHAVPFAWSASPLHSSKGLALFSEPLINLSIAFKICI